MFGRLTSKFLLKRNQAAPSPTPGDQPTKPPLLEKKATKGKKEKKSKSKKKCRKDTSDERPSKKRKRENDQKESNGGSKREKRQKDINSKPVRLVLPISPTPNSVQASSSQRTAKQLSRAEKQKEQAMLLARMDQYFAAYKSFSQPTNSQDRDTNTPAVNPKVGKKRKLERTESEETGPELKMIKVSQEDEDEKEEPQIKKEDEPVDGPFEIFLAALLHQRQQLSEECYSIHWPVRDVVTLSVQVNSAKSPYSSSHFSNLSGGLRDNCKNLCEGSGRVSCRLQRR